MEEITCAATKALLLGATLGYLFWECQRSESTRISATLGVEYVPGCLQVRVVPAQTHQRVQDRTPISLLAVDINRSKGRVAQKLQRPLVANHSPNLFGPVLGH